MFCIYVYINICFCTSGNMLVPVYDWKAFLLTFVKLFVGVSKWRQFDVSQGRSTVQVQDAPESETHEVRFNVTDSTNMKATKILCYTLMQNVDYYLNRTYIY